MPLHVLFSKHHAINTAHPSCNNFIGFRFLNASNTQLPVCVTTQSLVPPPLTFLNYFSCTALPALSALHQTHACSNSDASTAKLMAFALSAISVRIIIIFNNLPQDVWHSNSLPPFKNKLKTFLFSEHFNGVLLSFAPTVCIVSVSAHLCVCVCARAWCVCVCVCTSACVRACGCGCIYVYI